jgi:hypothetical protein
VPIPRARSKEIWSGRPWDHLHTRYNPFVRFSLLGITSLPGYLWDSAVCGFHCSANSLAPAYARPVNLGTENELHSYFWGAVRIFSRLPVIREFILTFAENEKQEKMTDNIQNGLPEKMVLLMYNDISFLLICHKKNTLRFLALPFHPHENKGQQHKVHRFRYFFGDLEAHVPRLLEETSPDSTV